MHLFSAQGNVTTLPRIGGMSKEKEDKKSNESTYDENKSTHFDMSENNTLTAESKMLLLFAFLNSPGLKCNHSLLDLSPNDCISFDLLPPSILVGGQMSHVGPRPHEWEPALPMDDLPPTVSP